MQNQNEKAFSILEISIVLIVIGLIFSSITGYRIIVNNSKLISTIKEIQNYVGSVSIFLTIYGELPGDMTDATTVFGVNDINGNSVNNGNGNGIIGDIGNTGKQLKTQESVSAFQELGLANLINGKYRGFSGTIGNDVPDSIYVNNGTYYILNDNFSGNYNYFNFLLLAKINSTNLNSEASVVKIQDAYNIDTKIDDGRPFTGKVISYSITKNCITNNPNIVSSSYSSTVRSGYYYAITSTSAYCTMLFTLDNYICS